MSRGKLILMSTKKPPNWKEWSKINNQKQAIKEKITMNQTDARLILEGVMGAESTEEACKILKSKLQQRKTLTFWLGQIGRRKDSRLGRNLDYNRYVLDVVKNLRSRENAEITAVDKELPTSSAGAVEKAKQGQESNPDEDVKMILTGTSIEDESAAQDIKTLTLSKWPFIDGFGLEGISRYQQYCIRSAVTLADCAVQANSEGITDVILRNFSEKWELSAWLHRIGKPHLIRHTKGKDMIDAARKISFELHKELRAVIGRPMARW